MKIFGIFFLIFMAWLSGAWGTMIVVGIAHSSWWHIIPTMGYGTAFALDAVPVLFAVITGIIKGALAEL
jgi:hypothetical protein